MYSTMLFSMELLVSFFVIFLKLCSTFCVNENLLQFFFQGVYKAVLALSKLGRMFLAAVAWLLSNSVSIRLCWFCSSCWNPSSDFSEEVWTIEKERLLLIVFEWRESEIMKFSLSYRGFGVCRYLAKWRRQTDRSSRAQPMQGWQRCTFDIGNHRLEIIAEAERKLYIKTNAV